MGFPLHANRAYKRAGAAFFVLFLALSGMPWSIFWGTQFGGMVDRARLGVPFGVWAGVATSDVQLSPSRSCA